MQHVLTPSRHQGATGRQPLDDVAEEFLRIRPRLAGIAHRILGSATDADDVVQDAWVRWQTCDRSLVVNSTAFLVTTTTRLALNAAQTAWARHESCVGQWVHEPSSAEDDPSVRLARTEAVELGLALLVERLTPAERAAFVLRHAFDAPYGRIAQVLRLSEANARQLVSRARRRLDTARQHVPAAGQPAHHQHRLLRAFIAAAQGGDVAVLEDELADAIAAARVEAGRNGPRRDGSHRRPDRSADTCQHVPAVPDRRPVERRRRPAGR